jgi:hypothetical protein
MSVWDCCPSILLRVSLEKVAVSATYRLPKADPPLADKSSFGFVFRFDTLNDPAIGETINDT